jgi:hypothetical protein
MNIKYVSLLSLLCAIASVDAARRPVTERLDEAKRTLIACRQSNCDYASRCQEELLKFNQAKHEFLLPHYKRASVSKRSTTLLEQTKEFTNASFFQRLRLWKKYLKDNLETQGHLWIIQALMPNEAIFYDEKYNDVFLADNRSIVEFSEYVLNQYHPELSNHTENRSQLHNVLIDPHYKSEVDEAKGRVMAVVHQQAQSSE